MGLPDFVEQLILTVISGGILAGLIDVFREKIRSKNEITSKKTNDETELSRMLLDQMHTDQADHRQTLLQRIATLELEIKTLRQTNSTIMEEALVSEKNRIRLSLDLESCKQKLLELENNDE